jgi:hypothetical protein
MEKISKRVNAIEEVNNNVKLLTEMVMSHSQGAASSSSRGVAAFYLHRRLYSDAQAPWSW